MNPVGTITLRQKGEKKVKEGRIWLRKDDIKRVSVSAPSGLVRITGREIPEGVVGLWDENSPIPVKVFDLNVDGNLKGAVIKKIKNAFELRKELKITDWDAYRLINSEGDRFPSLVVDVYRDVYVAQLYSPALEGLVDFIEEGLSKTLGKRQFVFKTPSKVVKKSPGFHSPYGVTVDGIHYLVDFLEGHKTGFYLDQRNARRTLTSLAMGKTVLDCFSYTGAFALHALFGGAEKVTCIESSPSACEHLRKNLSINGFFKRCEIINANVFNAMHDLISEGAKFDIVILDPPSFAPDEKSRTPALKAYRTLHSMASELINDNGFLFTFACSHHISLEDLLSTLYSPKRKWKVLRHFYQTEDHPYLLSEPSTFYLKGALLKPET